MTPTRTFEALVAIMVRAGRAQLKDGAPIAPLLPGEKHLGIVEWTNRDLPFAGVLRQNLLQ